MEVGFGHSLFLQAIHGQPVPRCPIWLMRQAGRYLPEYRKTRAQAGSFLKLCKNVELATEVTLQPLRRFDLDAAILFADILTFTQSFGDGHGLDFIEGKGPVFAKPVADKKSIDQMDCFDTDKHQYLADIIKTIQKALPTSTPLIGFAGSPWTVATYLIGGGKGEEKFKLAKSLIYQEPELANSLLRKLSRATIDYLNLQIHAGCDALMIFDSWAGILSSYAFERFSLKWIKNIIDHLDPHPEKGSLPIIVFCKGAGASLQKMNDLFNDFPKKKQGCAISLDASVPLSWARSNINDHITIQGNLDNQILCQSDTAIEKEVSFMFEDLTDLQRYIFNLGHGITPEIQPEKVAHLIHCVRDLSVSMLAKNNATL